MELNIDPHLSVYRLTERARKHSALLNHRRTMNVISYEIENASLIDGAKTRVFSAFQRMSRFIPQIPRYTKLAERSEIVYVFGIPDVDVPPINNITYIPLRPTDQLAREWFLVSFGPDYATMLATEEQTSIDDPDNVRQFRGLWTFEETLTAIVAEWLSRVVNAKPLDIDNSTHNSVKQHSYIENIKSRLDRRLARISKTPLGETVKLELSEIMLHTLPHSDTMNSLT